jgi:hypothetical protein
VGVVCSEVLMLAGLFEVPISSARALPLINIIKRTIKVPKISFLIFMPSLTVAANNPRDSESELDRVAYILPEGYGYGFRGPEDTFWGLWEADEFSLEISTQVGGFINARAIFS